MQNVQYAMRGGRDPQGKNQWPSRLVKHVLGVPESFSQED